MKYNIVLLFLFCFSTFAVADDRPKMVNQPEHVQEVEKLMSTLSETCNSGDFVAFMNCFTKKKAASIKKTMTNLFAVHALKINVISVEITEPKEKTIQYKTKYSLDSETAKQRHILTSNFTSRKENGFWRIDDEVILHVETIDKEIPNRQINFGGGGQVNLNPNDDFLPRDITRRPGNCANGQCGVNK